MRAQYIDQRMAEVYGRYGNDVIIIDKFGRNPVVNTTEEDIWQTGGTETLLTSAVTHYVSCTDNVNGVGQTILVNGLDGDWNIQNGIGVLTGQTQAAITKLDGSAATWTRIFRAYQSSATPDPVGDVYIAELDGTIAGGVPQATAKIHGFIDYTNGPQQTEKAMYTIPAGYTGFVMSGRASILTSSGAARSANVFFEIATLATGATVANPTWAPFRRIAETGLGNGSSSWTAEAFSFPAGPLPQLTNFHARATASADSEVTASFILKLVKTEWMDRA